MKIALAQLNFTVGDLRGNTARILAAYERASREGCAVILYPELAVTGYPPRDLIHKSTFIAESQAAIDQIAAATGQTAAIVGYVGRNEKRPGREATNAVALLQHGAVQANRVKTLLPTYDVFDEDRYFEPATGNAPVALNDRTVGLTICEDIWNDETFWSERRYPQNPARDLVNAGAGVIFNVSASPWYLGKNGVRESMLSAFARSARTPLFYCNMVGGNDELVFDGASLVLGPDGSVLARGKEFEEDYLVVDWEAATPLPPLEVPDEERLYHALVLGLRDYVQKCGFRSVVLGLSGGIDSALVAALAAEALGPENVLGVAMPTQFSSQGSLDDARDLAAALGIAYRVIPIQESFETVKQQLQPAFEGRAEDTTEENLQARLRGVTLMALSNKFGSLLLTTGNKSELAVGYCTIYGDMCGGLAVISDVPKTMVYRLSRWINRERTIIPWSSIEKPPSAELRPNQTDQDSLPPYEILDAILDEYVVRHRSRAEIVAMGFEKPTVDRVVRLVDLNEYKRRQAAPGLKVTTKAFGIGRRIPIAQRYESR